MKKLVPLLFLVVWLSPKQSVLDDRFDAIKRELAQAECTLLVFLSIIESDVFERVDSADGSAYISKDGRYTVTIGEDQYLYDRQHLYSYSAANNQVTVERLDEGMTGNEEISFVTRLDDFYSTMVVTPGAKYRLIKKKDKAQSAPDSLLVLIDETEPRLAQIEYYDINDELNRIRFVNQVTSDECDTSRFVPTFPDTVKIIRLW